jgi:hypothetical protein
MSSSIDERVLQTKNLLRSLKQQQQEEQRAARAAQPKKKRGRKLLSSEILIRARALAQRMPLSEVALRCDISLKSLYNKGMSRRALNRENVSNDVYDLCTL